MTIVVTYKGECISLFELSKRTEIHYSVLRKRYSEGDTGERLVRPIRVAKKRKPAVAIDVAPTEKQLAEQARCDRKRQIEMNRAKIAAEHAAAFAKPLIDGRLLRPHERQAVRERVKNCGQRNWCKNGGATF